MISTFAASTHEAQSLAEGGKYYWRVRAENVFGWGPYSPTRTFEVMKATSVEQSTNVQFASVIFFMRQSARKKKPFLNCIFEQNIYIMTL